MSSVGGFAGVLLVDESSRKRRISGVCPDFTAGALARGQCDDIYGKRVVTDGKPASPVNRARVARPEIRPHLAIETDHVENDCPFVGSRVNHTDG
jgi:hypothetical protein